MEGSRDVVKRHQFADYLNVGTREKPLWALAGTGFTTLDENPGAKSSKKKYINEKASSASVTSYETVFPFNSDLIPEEKAVLALYNVARNHKTGSGAELQYVRVELWDPVDEKTAEEFAARLFLVSVEVSSITGEDEISLSGNLNAVGDPVNGIFNVVAKAFTPEADLQTGSKPGGTDSGGTEQEGPKEPETGDGSEAGGGTQPGDGQTEEEEP